MYTFLLCTLKWEAWYKNIYLVAYYKHNEDKKAKVLRAKLAFRHDVKDALDN
jgi:hypothetical protein